MTKLRNTSNGVMTLLGEADVVLCNDKDSASTVVIVASDLIGYRLAGLTEAPCYPCILPCYGNCCSVLQGSENTNIVGFPFRLLRYLRQ